METFVALDVAIGLAFLYLLLSLTCTTVNEWIATVLRLRAKTLTRAVERLVDAPAHEGTGRAANPRRGSRLSTKVLRHSLIESISDSRGMPSYIPASRFAAALKDTLTAHREAPPGSPQRPDDVLAAQDVAYVRQQLTAMRGAPRFAAAAGDIDGQVIEHWFNEAMDRATGWYKRQISWITLGVAAFITVLSNADTFVAAKVLWQDPTTRAAVVAQAQERAKQSRLAETRPVQSARYADENMPVADPGGSVVKPLTPGTRSTPSGGRGSARGNTAATGAPARGSSGAARTTATPSGGGETTERVSEEDDNSADEQPETSADAVITDDEKAALAQIIGWSREFKAFNKNVCADRQKTVNERCKSGASTSEACRKALDEAVADGACVQGPNGLEPTDKFAGGSLIPLAVSHLPGWFVTTIAVSLGAPFWFDTLQRFVNLRGVGKKPDEKTAKDAARSDHN